MSVDTLAAGKLKYRTRILTDVPMAQQDAPNCGNCRKPILEGFDYCPHCGIPSRNINIGAALEAAKIIAVRELEEKSFKRLFQFFGALIAVSGLGVAAILPYWIDNKVQDQIAAELTDTRNAIRDEEELSRSKLRELQIAVELDGERIRRHSEATNTAQIEATETLERLVEEYGQRIAEAEKRRDELDHIIAAVGAEITLDDIVTSFYSVNTFEAKSQISFKDDISKLALENAHVQWYQINLFFPDGKVLQFLPNSNRPIGMGTKAVYQSHFLYPPSERRILGQDLRILEKVARVEFRIFLPEHDSRKNEIARQLMSGAEEFYLHLLVNGRAISQFHYKLEPGRNILSEIQKAPDKKFFITWATKDEKAPLIHAAQNYSNVMPSDLSEEVFPSDLLLEEQQ